MQKEVNATDHPHYCDGCERWIAIGDNCYYFGDYEVYCERCGDKRWRK